MFVQRHNMILGAQTGFLLILHYSKMIWVLFYLCWVYTWLVIFKRFWCTIFVHGYVSSINMFGNLCTIVKIIVFDIVFPTADAIGDVTFSIEAFSNSHFLIGFAMSIFVIVTFDLRKTATVRLFWNIIFALFVRSWSLTLLVLHSRKN